MKSKAGKYDPLKPKLVVPQARKLDVHQAITDKIVKAIEAGAGAFEMPWHRPGVSFDIPKNANTGKHYRGSNILSLWIDADDKKFEHQTWSTFKQWQELGAQVRKGEKGSLIVKYGEWTPKDNPSATTAQSTPSGDDAEHSKLMFAKAAWVFNVAQVDGFMIEAKQPRTDLTTRLDHVDSYIAATGADIRYGGQRAFYRYRSSDGSGDFIQMPDLALFTGTATTTPTESRYATLLHELGHFSGASHRLNREFGERFGDKKYAFEEIVVEIAAAYNCAHLEITNTPRPDHAQYIAHWLEILKGDKKAIFTAASLAGQIITYLDGLQPKAIEPDAVGEPARPDADPERGPERGKVAKPEAH
jgi:antirestriction protein ArdC